MSKNIPIIAFAGLLWAFSTLCRNAKSQASGLSLNWHENVFFGIHYDLHANAHDTELGRELTPVHLREEAAENPARLGADGLQGPSRLHELAYQGRFDIAR